MLVSSENIHSGKSAQQHALCQGWRTAPSSIMHAPETPAIAHMNLAKGAAHATAVYLAWNYQAWHDVSFDGTPQPA